jgi:hypothetical protein
VKEGVQFWEKVNVNGNNCQFARKEAAAFTANFGSRSSLIQTSAVSLSQPRFVSLRFGTSNSS